MTFFGFVFDGFSTVYALVCNGGEYEGSFSVPVAVFRDKEEADRRCEAINSRQGEFEAHCSAMWNYINNVWGENNPYPEGKGDLRSKWHDAKQKAQIDFLAARGLVDPLEQAIVASFSWEEDKPYMKVDKLLFQG